MIFSGAKSIPVAAESQDATSDAPRPKVMEGQSLNESMVAVKFLNVLVHWGLVLDGSRVELLLRLKAL